ncbi:hypothetical protein HAX54_027062, partial [Datura stramonium]|nr:hypothetical protein [Datura stramonium]
SDARCQLVIAEAIEGPRIDSGNAVGWTLCSTEVADARYRLVIAEVVDGPRVDSGADQQLDRVLAR